MINYNAALPAPALSGRRSLDINQWIGEFKGSLTALVRRMFANEVQGFWYDPNDLSTMFQDAAGTIPVTAAGQPVGLIRDKSGRNNHAYQTTSASRPILQQTPILGSELVVNGDFTDTTKFTKEPGWTVAGGNGVASGANGSVYQDVQSTVGKSYLISGEVLSRTGGSVRLLADGTDVPIVTTTMPKVFSYIVTASRASIKIGFRSIDGFTGTVDNLSVKELTGYHTDRNYLAFDGADDFLQTSNIDFTGTDKVSLFAGVRKLSDSAQGLITELGNAQISSFIMHCGGGVGTEAYTFGSRGTGLYSYAILSKHSNPSLIAPHSAVLTTKADITTSTFIKANGKSSINSINQGTGNYGNYPLYIGRRGGTSFPFNGHLYSLIGIGKLVSDSETVAIEKELAKRVGVTLNV